MKLIAAGKTDTGIVRSNNEDNFIVDGSQVNWRSALFPDIFCIPRSFSESIIKPTALRQITSIRRCVWLI